ncbi:hypothetical protein BH10PSE17_BH10PSE17_34830 [soil metagenome]
MHELFSSTVFSEVQFWLLVVSSVILPFGIYIMLMRRRSIARLSVLAFGVVLVITAGVDVYLLQRLSRMAALSPSLADDALFTSELSVALYILPALFGGIGINLVSHVLLHHLSGAERRFDNEGDRR